MTRFTPAQISAAEAAAAAAEDDLYVKVWQGSSLSRIYVSHGREQIGYVQIDRSGITPAWQRGANYRRQAVQAIAQAVEDAQ